MLLQLGKVHLQLRNWQLEGPTEKGLAVFWGFPAMCVTLGWKVGEMHMPIANSKFLRSSSLGSFPISDSKSITITDFNVVWKEMQTQQACFLCEY